MTLLSLGCGNSAIPCATSNLYYSNPTLPTSASNNFNNALGGFNPPSGGTFLIASPTTIYVGSDTTGATGGLRKFIGTPSPGVPTGANWGEVNFGSGAVLNAPGAVGVHGLAGRYEGTTYVIYFSSSSTPAGATGNGLYRYDTTFDGAATAGAGFTALSFAPSGFTFLGVYSVPTTPTTPVVPWVSLTANVSEHAAAFTVIGSISFVDPTGNSRPATAFTWSILNDPTGGMFAITAAGVVIIANSTLNPPYGPGFNYALTGPGPYTLSIVLSDMTNPFNVGRAYTTAVITVQEINNPPVLSPASQLVAFQEVLANSVPRTGTAVTSPITTYKENGPTSPFYSPVRVSLLPPASSACGAIVAPAQVPTANGAVSGSPLFSINSTSGVVTLIGNASTATGAPWSLQAPFIFRGAFVRVAYALCVNVSDGLGAWTAGFVYAVSLPDTSLGFVPPNITSIVGGNAIPANAGGCGAGAPGPTAVITFRGTGFGPPGTAPSTTTVTYGPTGIEYVCTPLANNTNTSMSCAASAGTGTNLAFTITVNGQPNSPPAPGLSLSYAGPTITRVAPGAGITSLALLPTLGGGSLLVTGTNFGCNNAAVPVNLFFTYAPTGVTLASPSACTHSTTAPSTNVTCVVPPGVGVNLGLSVRVGAMPLSNVTAGRPANGTGVSYVAPTWPAGASSVIMPSGPSATLGGAAFAVTGAGFGPALYPGSAVDFALYSSNVTALAIAATALAINHTASALLMAALTAALPSRGVASNATVAGAPTLPPGVFGAAGCSVAADTTLSCLMGAGSGSGLSLLMSIGGQLTPTFPAELSYAPPQVVSFSGAGASGAPSVGGSTVFVTGTNLGPANDFTNSRLVVSYTATWPRATSGFASWTYTNVPCAVTTAHTTLTCIIEPGGGSNLAWTIVLDGLESSLPLTSYAPPAIIAIVEDDGVSAAPLLQANGGDVLQLLGTGFGPADFYNVSAQSPLLSSVTYGPTGVEYSAASFTVLNDGASCSCVSFTATRACGGYSSGCGAVEFVTSPGTGAITTVLVRVAGQVNSWSPSLAYAPPTAVAPPGSTSGLALVPSSGPTTLASTLATITLQNLPLLDTTITRMTVFFGAVAATPLVPLTSAAIAAATNADGSVSLSFPLPTGGVGSGIPVTIALYRGATLASSSAPSPLALFSYNDPVITNVALVSFVASGTACPAAIAGGMAAPWSCSSTSLLLATITGANFGTEGGTPGVTQQITIVDGSSGATSIATASGPGTAPGGSNATSTLLYRIGWTDTSITYLTTVPLASVTVAITSSACNIAANNDVTYAPFTQLATRAYSSHAITETIYNIGGGGSANVPTTGGLSTAPLLGAYMNTCCMRFRRCSVLFCSNMFKPLQHPCYHPAGPTLRSQCIVPNPHVR